MRHIGRRFIGVAALLLIGASAAPAETWELTLKRIDPSRPDEATALGRQGYPQRFFYQFGSPEAEQVQRARQAEFDRIVKKKPARYNSAHPLKGVVRFGTRDYAFAFDTSPPKASVEKAEKEADDEAQADKAEKEETEEKEAEKDPFASPAKDDAADAEASEAADDEQVALAPYTRLHFDFNRNGDLTDDKVVEALGGEAAGPFSLAMPIRVVTFPRVDLVVECDGRTHDYAFTVQAYGQRAPGFHYAQVMFQAAAYREGEIELGGQKRRVALIDYNSNGRFDDRYELPEAAVRAGGRLYPQMGDMLLVDSEGRRLRPGFGESDGQMSVAKLVSLDGRFYDLGVTPAGDRLTLDESKVALGYVTNPSQGFRAVVFGDQGILPVQPDESGKAALPAGSWRLLSYTIDRESDPEEAPPPPPPTTQSRSLLEALGSALVGGTAPAPAVPASRLSRVSARATGSSEPVEVTEGATVTLPFGPPYKPVVEASPRPGGTVWLSLSLVGQAGEVCDSLIVHGRRPPPPEFTITGPNGEVVQTGNFEYG